MKALPHILPRQGAPALDRIRAVLRDRARRHRIQSIEGLSYAYLAGCARCTRRHAIRIIKALVAAGEIGKEYTTRPGRGMSRNRYRIKSLRVFGTTLPNNEASCTNLQCHPDRRADANPKKAPARGTSCPTSARRPMSPRTRPIGVTRRNYAVPRDPLDVLGRLFPAVRDVPAARRSAISVLRKLESDRWPDFRAKAEQLAGLAHHYRSAWAVWYRWARAELDGTRRWHETGPERRQLEDRATAIRRREAPPPAWLDAMKAQLLAGMT